MATHRVHDSVRVLNGFSPLSKLANELQARHIVDRICRDVVTDPDNWRTHAVSAIAIALDIAERRQ